MKLVGILAPLSAKLILGLAVALAASVSLNAMQAKRAWVAYGEAKAAPKIAKLASENAGLTKTAAINDALATRAKPENAQLLTDLAAIAERGRETRVVYKQAAAKSPLAAVCVPGQARMDAVNGGLGPQKVAKP